MGFQYETVRSPYGGTIADLLQEPGRIRAQQAVQVGNAQAQAAQASGNAWGGAIQNIGGMIAAIPQQMQQQKMMDARLAEGQALAQERQMRAQQGLDLQKQNAFIDQTMQGAMKTDDATGIRTFDRSTFEKSLVDGGMGHLYPELSATLDKLDASAAKRTAEGRSLYAHSLVGIEQAGYTPQSLLSAAAFLKANGAITDQQLQPLQAALAQDASPEAIQKLVAGMGQTLPEYQALKIAEEKRKTDLAQTAAQTAKLTAETAGTLPPTPAQAEAARHNLAAEATAAQGVTRMDASQREAMRHNRATEATAAQAANPFGISTGGGAMNPATGTQGPTGEEFLKTLSPAMAAQVKAYADGRRPFPTGMAAAKLQPLIGLVSQYDPTFDAGNYNARNKARMDLTSQSGTGGKIVNSLNTAIQHAGKLSDLIEALDNSETPAANAVANWWNKQSGGTKVTNFEAVQPQLMKEIERLWRGAGGSAGEIDELKRSLGPNMGRQQQREGLVQFVDLMTGKLQATEQQRDNVLGATAGKDVPILFDQSKPILEKLAKRATPGDASAALKEGTAGTVNGVPAVWKTVNGKSGWYAK